MSTASKITFGTTCLFAVGSFIFINVSQQTERESMRQGPVKDAARLRELSKKQRVNALEHQEQAELRERLAKEQPLLGEIIVGDDDK